MHFTTTTATLLSLSLSALAAPTATDYAAGCAKNGQDVLTAITNFCAKSDIVVPSDYAYNGLTVGKWKVYIAGDCSPAQWVPTYWCEQQLQYVCARGSTGLPGEGFAEFGNKNCQSFVVETKKFLIEDSKGDEAH